MSFDINKNLIQKHSSKIIFLIDSSAYCFIEEIEQICGFNVLEIIHNSKRAHFFITNEVFVELMNGPRKLDPAIYINHLLNVESSMDSDWKENRFLIEENGAIKYVVLNKISSVDYGQILLCQNHPELILVTNDRKILRSSAQIIPGRIYGTPRLVERMLELESTQSSLKIIQATIKSHYEMKSPFKDN